MLGTVEFILWFPGFDPLPGYGHCWWICMVVHVQCKWPSHVVATANKF